MNLLVIFVHAIRSLLLSRAELALENIALRQQLAVPRSKSPRPRVRPCDRLFWISLRALWPGWARLLVIVQPATVVAWHRQVFRLSWRWRSRPRRPGRPRISSELRALIRRMASENPTWGAPRIHGELAKLGFDVSERTVSRYMPRRPAPPEVVERWKTFLRNHRDVIAAADFFTVPTAAFQQLYVFFVIGHARRRVLHFNVTTHPNSDRIVRQLCEAFPFDTAPRYLIIDRDGKYGHAVPRLLEAAAINLVRTAWRSPRQNGVAERWIGTARRELLDHVVVLNQRRLRRLLRDYVTYYHEDRCHLTLAKDTPAGRQCEHRGIPDAGIVALPRVGGLHHRYPWAEAA